MIAKRNMAIEIQKSKMGTWKRYDHSKKNDDLDSPTNNSTDSQLSTDAIIVIDDDVEVQTLEPKKKKPRLGSWWDDVDAFNELNCVVKGSLKLNNKEDNDALSSREVSCFSSTEEEEEKKKDVVETSLSTLHAFIDLCDDDDDEESTVSENTSKSVIDDRVGFRHVSLEDLDVSVEHLKSIPWEAFDPTWEIRSVAMDPWLGGYIQDLSPF